MSRFSCKGSLVLVLDLFLKHCPAPTPHGRIIQVVKTNVNTLRLFSSLLKNISLHNWKHGKDGRFWHQPKHSKLDRGIKTQGSNVLVKLSDVPLCLQSSRSKHVSPVAAG